MKAQLEQPVLDWPDPDHPLEHLDIRVDDVDAAAGRAVPPPGSADGFDTTA